MRQDSNHKLSAVKRQRGFSLIEALVALLVVSFGMLAIASFQFTLARNSDLAKQRTEATRLAQQKMEQLRAYGQVQTNAATPHVVNYTDDVVSSTAAEVFTTNTNATFSRTWTVTANTSDTEKWINVMVDWVDRTNAPQQVQLFSVISKYDPQDLGALSTFVPGAPGGQRRPKNRNINIPYPAVTLASCPGGAAGACSAFTPPPGNVIYVFDNNTGNITNSCTPNTYPITGVSGTGTTVTATTSGVHPFAVGDMVTIAGSSLAAANGTFRVTATGVTPASPPGVPNPIYTLTYTVSPAFASTQTGTGGTVTRSVTLSEGIDLSTVSGLTCTGLQAYLLSGYVRFDTSNNPTGAEPGNLGTNNNTLPLSPSTPLSLDTSNQSGGTPTMTCYAQQQKVVTTNSSNVTITAVARSGNRVTVTAAGHGYSNDNVVAISQVTPAGFSGAYVVTVVSSSQFTYDLASSVATGLPTTGGVSGAFTKLVERLTVAETTTVAGYGGVSARFVSYACIVTPVAGTPPRWWGRATLNSGPGWVIGTSGSEFKVCRYSADYSTNGSGTISNSEHPLWYRGVTGPLDSQNYLVIAGNRNCPTDDPQNLGSPFNASDDTTWNHQPSGALSCATASCPTPATQREPSNTATDLLMD
jgi:type IV pilus modification protein PilV